MKIVYLFNIHLPLSCSDSLAHDIRNNGRSLLSTLRRVTVDSASIVHARAMIEIGEIINNKIVFSYYENCEVSNESII